MGGAASAAPGGVVAVIVDSVSGQSGAVLVAASGPAAGQANGSGAGSGPSGSVQVNGNGNVAAGSGNAPAAVNSPGNTLAASGAAPSSTNTTLTVTDPVSGLTTSYKISAPARLQDSTGHPSRILVGDPLGGSFSLPGGGLFRLDTAPGAGFLIQANGGLSSNAGLADSDDLYDLTGKTLKRLGDSLYEQRLVQEQIVALTGRTNLGNYADSQAQFAALVANGSAYAQAYGIAPGIALSAEQMQSLTQDIVWLETREIDTPQGKQQALVPVVYVAALKSHDLDNQGGISGNTIVLAAAEALVNQGAIEGEQIAASGGSFSNSGSLTATQGASIVTTGGDLISSGTITGGAGPVLLASARDIQIESASESISATLGAPDRRIASFEGQQVVKLAAVSGGDVRIEAANDLRIAGAEVSAAQSLDIRGKNVTLSGVVQTAASAGQASNGDDSASHANNNTQLGSVIQAGGDLSVRAEQDLAIIATRLDAQGDALLSAGANLEVRAEREAKSYQFAAHGYHRSLDYATRDESLAGSQIRAGNNLSLGAGGDLVVAASSLKTGAADGSGGGNLSLTAGRDVGIAAGSELDTLSVQSSRRSSGFFSSSSSSSSDVVETATAVGSTLSSGARLDISAGRDVVLAGSSAVAQGEVEVAADGKLSLEAAASTRDEAHARQETKSGLFSGGGLSITLGNSSQKQTSESASVYNSGTTLGSLGGDVTLLAGIGYRQLGSAVLAPLGSITISAPTVEIGAVRDTASTQQTFEAKQSGLTLSVSNPVVDAARSLQSLTQAAGQTSDPRMLALAAAAGALTAKNTYDALKGADGAIDPSKAAALNIGLSLGSSRSQSNSESQSSTVAGSSVTAGNDLTIQATAGDLTVTGSTLTAGNNASLAAAGNLSLLGAASTSNSQSSSSGSAASIGVGFNTVSGLYVSASASKSNGSGNGNDTLWTTTQVEAGNRLTLESGNDTTLKGAVASGKQVVAEVGGNLHIESLQDASTYRERGSSAGFSVTVPLAGGGFSASVNGGMTRIDSNYLSVTEQSGIQAGDGGFQIAVAGNTDLKGAVIASSDQAVLDGKNSLTSATLTTSDIQNKAEYSGQSINLGVGYSTLSGGGVGQDAKGNAATGTDQTPGSALASLNGWSATPPVALSASGNADSVTRSAISAGQIILTDEAKQQALTGQDAAATIASLNRDTASVLNGITPIFNKQEIQAGFEIAGTAVRQVGIFMNNRAQESTQAKTELDKENAKPADQQDQGKITQLTQTLKDNTLWEMGGTGRTILTALTAAAGGNVTGTTAQMIQGATVNYLQSLGAQQVKLIAD